jgi:hypothetical protein
MKNTNQTTKPDEIECPKCGELIPVTEALENQLSERIRKDFENKNSEREKELEEKEKLVIAKEKSINEQVNQKLELEKGKLEKEATKKAEEKVQVELRDKDEQLKEKDQALREAQQAQLNALKKEREADEKIKNVDLEVEKRLKAGKDKLEDDISKRYADTYNLKDQEKQKKIDDLAKQLDDAKRRLEQGSQQLQGEVQELDLENSLKETFPQDIIEPIGKGVKGADVRQKVKSSSGKICGVILWESKRAQNWGKDWISKLKENQRAEAAHIPVIVSTVLPDEASSGFGQKDGVWICKPSLAISLSQVLRRQLLEVALVNAQSEKQGTLAETLYEYVTSHAFRQQVESMVETYKEMKEQVTKERVAFEKSWKMRDAQIDKIFIGTANIVGSIQGKLGNNAFGPVKGLELLEGGDDKISVDELEK